MSQPNPFSMAGGVSSGSGEVPQHGSTEQWSGTVFAGAFGVTPPASRAASPAPTSPRNRSPSAAGRRFSFTAQRNSARARRTQNDEEETENRSRERRRAEAPPEDDPPLPTGWGARMLASEKKIQELEKALTHVQQVVVDTNEEINRKVDTMKAFVQEVEGRFGQLEKALPERIHKGEERQEYFVTLLNNMGNSIHERFLQIEQLMQKVPQPAPQTGPQPTTQAPPVPPSFGGPTAPNVEHFNLGSPLSGPPPQEAASNTPAFDPWARMAKVTHAGPPLAQRRAWDSRMWGVADMKISKELKPFNGTDGMYRTWAQRVKDHFTEKNPDWYYVFAEIEKQKEPIVKEALTMNYLNGDGYSFEVDFKWMANSLWTFIGKHLVDAIYNNRGILSGGNNNGLELWRALFIRHEGGADQVELGGMGNLHSFPQCDKPENLQLWIGKWQEMKDLYGAGISDVHLKSMFVNILPPLVQKEVREKTGLHTLQQCINHVLSDLGRLNDLKLSKLHSERLKQSLSSSQRLSPLTEPANEDIDEAPKPEENFTTIINLLSNKMDTIAAAMARPKARPKPSAPAARPPSLYAEFGDRCLICGSEEHRAAACPVKKSLMAKNGVNCQLTSKVHLTSGRLSSPSLLLQCLKMFRRNTMTMNPKRPHL